MGILANFILVPVVMACALGGTIGMIWLIKRFSPKTYDGTSKSDDRRQ